MARIGVTCWHCPYSFLLATALGEGGHEVVSLPTPYAPGGWRLDQRPQPANVRPVSAVRSGAKGGVEGNDLFGEAAACDLLVLNAPQDVARYAPSGPPLVYVGHNHARLEPKGFVPYLDSCREVERLVVISPMKASSWREAGWRRGERVILPGIAPGLMALASRASQPEPDRLWTGTVDKILTVANRLDRPLFDEQGWLRVVRSFGRALLVGLQENHLPYDDEVGWFEADLALLRALYRSCRVFLSPTVPPYEDAWNLARLEAHSVGMPVVGFSEPAGDPADPAFPPAARSTYARIKDILGLCLESPKAAREYAEETTPEWQRWFPWERFSAQWRDVVQGVLDEHGRG